MRPISKLPHAPNFLLGMIDVRGAGYPIVDLRTKLHLPRVRADRGDPHHHSRRPAEGTASLGVGFVADRVLEVTGLDERSDRAAARRRRPLEVRLHRRHRPQGRRLRHHLRSRAADGVRRRCRTALCPTCRRGLRPMQHPRSPTTLDHLSDRYFQGLRRSDRGARSASSCRPPNRRWSRGGCASACARWQLRRRQRICSSTFSSAAISKRKWSHLIDCVTTNKTDFFREPRHFDFLRDVAVPALLKLHADAGRPISRSGAPPARPARRPIPIAMVLDDMSAPEPRFPLLVFSAPTFRPTCCARRRRRSIRPAFIEPVPAAMRQALCPGRQGAGRDGVARIVPGAAGARPTSSGST